MTLLPNQRLMIIAALFAFVLILLLMRRARVNRDAPPAESKALFAPERNFAAKIRGVFSREAANVAQAIPAIEEILLTADVGVTATEALVAKAFANGAATPEAAIAALKNEIVRILTPQTAFAIDTAKKPFVIYLVGVNGVGKTTTIGKLASQLQSAGHKVMLVAADTFRAAAVDQLRVWSERNGALFVGGAANSDPSSVIVDGLRSAKAKGVDVVLVDTAGRLHTKSNLMEELRKMARMADKEIGRAPDEIFLVVDAVTGQNGFNQAKVFLDAVPVSGVVLTKYDGTSKGGIIIAIADQTRLPIRYLGLGEKIEDLKKFDAQEFVERLFA